VFRADVVVHLDTRRAAASDDLTRTVDYGVLAEKVAGVLSGDPADLIETVAERIAATALADPAVTAVDVAVHKPQAPVTVPFEDVVVRVRRDRQKLPAAEPWTPPVAPVPDARSASPVGVPSPSAGLPAASGAVASPAAGVASGRVSSQPVAAVPDRLDQRPAAPVEAVLALGSNLGAPQSTLRAAVADIEGLDGVEIADVSPLARTVGVGGPEQPDFLNTVVIVRTTLAARELLHAVQSIEQAHGRERRERWGPRTLDIDVITYDTTLAVTDDLELPHPRAHERAFVLEPWAQVAPDAVLPGLGGGPVAALAATAPDRGGVRWLALDWMTAPAPRDAAPAPSSDEPPGDARPTGGQDDGAPAGQAGPPAEPARGPAPVDAAPREPAPVDATVSGAAPPARPPGGASPTGATDVAVLAVGAPPTGPDGAAPRTAAYPGPRADADGRDAGDGRQAPDGPLDWLPTLQRGDGASGAADASADPRTGVFPPVLPPGEGPHTEDRDA